MRITTLLGSLCLVNIALANNYACTSDTVIAEPLKLNSQSSQLMVFVSLAMPKHSLQQWNTQVTKAGGTLMLRGLVNNSMRETTKKVKAIIGDLEGGFAVDPNKFKQFEIKAVPVVIIAENNSQLFDSVAGDVGLERALERIIADGEHKDLAKEWLRNLRGNYP